MRRRWSGLGLCALGLCGPLLTAGAAATPSQPAAAEPAAPPPALRFVRDGRLLGTVALPALVGACGSQVVELHDPYYGSVKRFDAVPLRCALRLGFGALPAPDASLFLRARDGYVRPASGATLLTEGGWLAFADADLTHGDPASASFRPIWQPVDRRQLDPAPFYLVWSDLAKGDPHRMPWPYQLAEIESAPFESRYPHVAPPGVPADSPARRGFAIFRDQCIACHAINGEGGTVGPDLNVPRSIVEYRPKEQIKAYVRNPQSFRYTTMPAHPGLSDADLDALVAYFEVMSHHKHDPRRASAGASR